MRQSDKERASLIYKKFGPDKIWIDFLPGSHGHFLEFVCNKFLAGIDTKERLPFNDLNASHQKTYLGDTIFLADHFRFYDIVFDRCRVVSIRVQPRDLLALQCVSLLRAADLDIDPDGLEIDTFHKLNNERYRPMIDTLRRAYFRSQDLIEGYQAVADTSWPKIETLDQYFALPESIRQECELEHGLRLKKFDEANPHCDREILRDFFRRGFLDTDQHGLIQQQNKNTHVNCQVYQFDYAAFYDWKSFILAISGLADFFHMQLTQESKDEIQILHDEFLVRQPFRRSKERCDQIVKDLLAGAWPCMDDLNVIEESYIASEMQQRDPDWDGSQFWR